MTKLDPASGPAVFAGFPERYREWKLKADAGNRQMWTVSVAKAIGSLETMILKQRK